MTQMDFTMNRIDQTLQVLQAGICRETIPVDQWRYSPCGYKQGNELPDPMGPDFRDFGRYERWGEVPDSHAWFFTRVTVPEAWAGQTVRLRLETGSDSDWHNPQFLAYLDGVMVQGMDKNHRELDLTGRTEAALTLYAYPSNTGQDIRCPSELTGFLERIDPSCEKLYYDLRVPYEVLRFSEPNTRAFADVLRILRNAVDLLDCRCPGSERFYASIPAAEQYLQKALYTDYCTDQPETVLCIGHTHIDVAWLWTLAQTREKVQRSFSTVLRLMERYPEYRFMSSQAQLYAYLKEESPETYEQVKAMVAAGRWEVEGGMWVEADCNLTSGESLVRQILFGKRFFRKEFGVDNRVLWLPDVFGYSAALPQILRKSGIDRFITSKISWNETNQMPCDLFRWRGIDGSEVLSYFLTAQTQIRGEKPANYTTYNSNNDPASIAGAWNRFQQKEFSHQVLNTFGFGDGGGGPTAEMLEMRRRMERGFGACPNARIGTVTEFVEGLTTAEQDPRLPVWSGELYLELHRGTYTSIARNKRYNRQCELAYQAAELFSEMGGRLLNLAYPREILNRGWETILLYQFHDIIPGSSIKAVYDECDRVYPTLLAQAEELKAEAQRQIAERVTTEGGTLVFNPHGFPWSGPVVLEGQTRFVENIPAKGYAVVQPRPLSGSVILEDRAMENAFLRVELDENGNLTSIYDKRAHRQVLDLTKGPGNRLEVYEDYPRSWDAWEISNYYRDKVYCMDQLEALEPVRDGARSGFRLLRRFLESTVEQTIWMYEDIAKLDFETTIHWNQHHQLLKAAFPVRINANRATYEIQFGSVERPTHENTSWDAAKFEVCAHKYCDLSEYGYGVAMLNDCKYGHDIHHGVLRLTLLKSASYPNPEADQGLHRFTYSIVPHQGDFREAGVVQLAYDLNDPMTALPLPAQSGSLPERHSLVSVSAPNVIVDTVKQAEDSDALILRLYEAWNQSAEITVTFGFAPKRVRLCDLMEQEGEELPLRGNTVMLPVRPFEIITLKAD